MNPQTLYVLQQPLADRLTLGLLRQHIQTTDPLWISLEPRPWLPQRDGKRLTGRLPGIEPLARTLPEGLDDLPLLAASVYTPGHWQHFHDAHPLSGLPGQCITWSLESQEGSRSIEVLCRRQPVLTWQDRHRFGLAGQGVLPPSLETEHYYQNGKRLAWRLLPTEPNP
ncbi:hypothetical protein [Thermomonas flagellata]|uniref:hypothetical protein n=1 Tax=Thermomonas flagellata TaxID=2888524 RepID=UPI001F03FDA3|nr:hypothetical protein [Thermomonas flagellata]